MKIKVGMKVRAELVNSDGLYATGTVVQVTDTDFMIENDRGLAFVARLDGKHEILGTTKPSATYQELRDLVLEIDRKGKDLSNWEVNFIANLVTKFRLSEDAFVFSKKQAEVIRRIHSQRVEE